jgi:hypothetical protein
MPQRERHAQRTAGITGGRLNPNLFERSFPFDPAVAHAVERHASGEAQIAQPCFAMRKGRHLQHHFFGDVLDRSCKIHLALCQPALGLPRRTAQQPFHRRSRHRQRVRVGEELLVHPQAAVIADFDEVILDGFHEGGLAVRRQAHDLVLSGVHLEAGKIGKSRIEQAEGVRKPLLAQERQLVALADANRRRRPLTDAVHRHHRGLLERRREKCRRRV